MTIATYAQCTYYEEDQAPKELPRVRVSKAEYSLANVEGTLIHRPILSYTADGKVSFVFTDVIEVTNLAGKKGGFFTQGKGSYTKEQGHVQGAFEMVDGSGTGDFENLKGLRGSFKSRDEHGENVDYVFEM